MFFAESAHKYYKKNLGDYKYISASKVSERYSEPFDEQYWSLYKAYEFWFYRKHVDPNINIRIYTNKEDANLIKNTKDHFKQYKKGYKVRDYKLFDHLRMFADEDQVEKIKNLILNLWRVKNEKSQVKGNTLHDYKEDRALFDNYVLNPWTKNKLRVRECNKKITDDITYRTVDINNLKEGYFPEITINYDIFCGRVDKLLLEPMPGNKMGFWIDDWKTNEEIKMENPFAKLKYPVNHLDDCNWNHYRIQIGIYIWIMIQLGYQYQGSKLTHCILNEDTGKWSYRNLQFNYLAQEIEDITADIYIDNI